MLISIKSPYLKYERIERKEKQEFEWNWFYKHTRNPATKPNLQQLVELSYYLLRINIWHKYG